jgi:O-antigen ligase
VLKNYGTIACSGHQANTVSRRNAAPAWIADTRNSGFVAFLVGLLIWRMVIPGVFTYDENATPPTGITDLVTNQLVWLTLLAGPLLLLRSRLDLTRRLIVAANPVLWVLLAYAGASTLWSLDSGATLRRSLHLFILMNVAVGASLVAWHPRRYQALVRPTITVLLVGSLLFGLLDPSVAFTEPNVMMGEHGRHLRGLTDHKNALGALASFGAIFWFHGWLYNDVKVKSAVFGLLTSVLCLVLAGSSTSMLGTFFTIGFFLLTKSAAPSLRRFIPFITVIFVAIILAYGLAVLRIVPALDFLITSITDVTGKDATFTGRTPIWEIVKEHIAKSPVIGSGYGGYWTGDTPGTDSSIVKKKLFFYPQEAHNGYLDVINDLGYVGVGILICFVVCYLIMALRLLKIDRSQAILFLGLLFYELLSNLSESTWMQIAVPWMLSLYASISTSRALLEQQLQNEFGNAQAPRRVGRRLRSRHRPA